MAETRGTSIGGGRRKIKKRVSGSVTKVGRELG